MIVLVCLTARMDAMQNPSMVIERGDTMGKHPPTAAAAGAVTSAPLATQVQWQRPELHTLLVAFALVCVTGT